jgi:hypothetical protein
VLPHAVGHEQVERFVGQVADQLVARRERHTADLPARALHRAPVVGAEREPREPDAPLVALRLDPPRGRRRGLSRLRLAERELAAPGRRRGHPQVARRGRCRPRTARGGRSSPSRAARSRAPASRLGSGRPGRRRAGRAGARAGRPRRCSAIVVAVVVAWGPRRARFSRVRARAQGYRVPVRRVPAAAHDDEDAMTGPTPNPSQAGPPRAPGVGAVARAAVLVRPEQRAGRAECQQAEHQGRAAGGARRSRAARRGRGAAAVSARGTA